MWWCAFASYVTLYGPVALRYHCVFAQNSPYAVALAQHLFGQQRQRPVVNKKQELEERLYGIWKSDMSANLSSCHVSVVRTFQR